MLSILTLKWRLTTIYTRLRETRKKVVIGQGVVFMGTPIISGSNLGQITIGARAVLVSDPRGTALGVSSPATLRLLASEANITIGADTGLSGTKICAAKSINIGERCLIGADVLIFDTDFHNHPARHRRYSSPQWDKISRPIDIGDDVFLGARCIISKGAVIGSGCIIAAGSIVTGYIPPYSIAAGAPAKVIGTVPTQIG